MDSASPIAARTAGEYAFETGATFTFAMRNGNAENTHKRSASGVGRDRPGGCRHRYRRSYGEGRAA